MWHSGSGQLSAFSYQLSAFSFQLIAESLWRLIACRTRFMRDGRGEVGT